MNKITIGAEIHCSQIVLGTMMFIGEPQDDPMIILDEYINTGGNCIDTAHIYGEKSVRTVGAWLKDRNNRSNVILIGKGAHPDNDGLPRVTLESIEQDIAETFEWMQTDYFDIFMLHKDDPNQPVGYILEALNKQLEEDKCRAIGVSNWTIDRINEANQYAVSHGLVGLQCSSPNLSLAKPNEPRWPGCVSIGFEDMKWYSDSQTPVFSWSAQGGGFFTGRYTKENGDPNMVRVYYHKDNWERYNRAKVLGKKYNCSANHIALAYVLNQKFPTCALIGPNNVKELRDSTAFHSLRLLEEEIKWLDLTSDNGF